MLRQSRSAGISARLVSTATVTPAATLPPAAAGLVTKEIFRTLTHLLERNRGIRGGIVRSWRCVKFCRRIMQSIPVGGVWGRPRAYGQTAVAKLVLRAWPVVGMGTFARYAAAKLQLRGLMKYGLRWRRPLLEDFKRCS